MLLKKLEGALLGDIARLLELGERLLACGVLLLRHNAALASLHQVLLGEPTGSVLGRTVPHLGLRASRHHLATRLHILAGHVRRIHRVGVHFYTKG
jgi:hypothetical protein